MSKKDVNPALYDVIRSPVVTEKSSLMSQFNKITFRVATDATKADVKEAVEAIFSVKVRNVNTLNKQGKRKRFRQTMGQRAATKKAIVTLEEGQTIDVMGGA